MPQPVSVHLICGFLGAGKTTLLMRILVAQPQEERLVVVVNEFGELGIDGQLLVDQKTGVLELTNGCICCTLKNSFIDTLTDALHKFDPQRIVVEASGLTKAGELARAVDELASHSKVDLDSLVTVVDSEIFPIRHRLGWMYFDQIETADLLLLNKIDLASAEDVENMLKDLSEMNTHARIMPVVHCTVDRETILAPFNNQVPRTSTLTTRSAQMGEILPGLFRASAYEGHEHDHDRKHRHEVEGENYISFSFQHTGTLDPNCLKKFLDDLPWELFRLKGFVRLPGGMAFLNYTYRRPELVPVEDKGLTRLAFVGWGIQPREFLNRIEACVLA